MRHLFGILGLAILSLAYPAQAVESLISVGQSQRAGMLACPSGSIMTGVAPNGSAILCLSNYDRLTIAERVDENPPTQWPASQGVPLLDSIVRDAHGYTGGSMHSCARDEVATGLHLQRNAFLCVRLLRKFQPHTPGRYEVVSNTFRSGALACPRGMAVAGLHFGNQTLLCAEVHLCRDNAQCSQGLRCRTNDPSEREVGLLCAPTGVVRLNKDDNCRGDIVRFIGTAAGTGIANLGSDGDEARSALLLGVRDGALLEFYDDSNFSRGDDIALFRTTRSINSFCINNLDLPPDGMLMTPSIIGLKQTTGNLAGKLSSLQFFSQIRDSQGRCVVRSAPTNSLAAEVLSLGDCAVSVRWFREIGGTIRFESGNLQKCLSAYPFTVRDTNGTVVAPGQLAYRECSQISDDKRWSFTSLGQMKVYSNYCLTHPGSFGFPPVPTIEVCQLPVPANQRWFANL